MCAIYLELDGKLVPMVETPYEAEHVLQQLLADNPGLLAGEVDPSAPDDLPQWLLIQREMGVADQADAGDRWSADHLFLDRHAVPTLVEVKRSSNTQIRREIVGQILEYAANAKAHWPAERMREAFYARHADPATGDAEVARFLGGDDPDEFWDHAAGNLESGRLRLVVAADRIPGELRRVIEFLNEQMSRTEVLALEVRRYREKDGSRATFAPRLVGNTQAARDRKTSRGSRGPALTEDDLREGFSTKFSTAVAERALRLLRSLRDAGAEVRVSNASIIARLDTTSGPVHVGLWRDGGASINIRHFRDHWNRPDLDRFANRIAELPSFAAAVREVQAKDYRTFIPIPLPGALGSDEALDRLTRLLLEPLEG